jgi:hypothetical protein
MAKTIAPLLSFDAAGQIAKAQVYARWRGVGYARRYVIPSNPDTAEQQLTRNTFRWLGTLWSYLPALVTDGWNRYADGQPMTGKNAFIKLNLANMREETDLALFLFSPAAKSGPVAAGMVVTPGNDELTVDLTAPSPPAGWAIAKARVAAIKDQDPQTDTVYTVASGFDATSTYQVVLTGLAHATLYEVGGWFKYTKPDGSFAYGPALMATGLTT